MPPGASIPKVYVPKWQIQVLLPKTSSFLSTQDDMFVIIQHVDNLFIVSVKLPHYYSSTCALDYPFSGKA
jgi:hypothetical protein